MMPDFCQEFVRFAISQGVLCFGEFQTKAGRVSPYFFNTGLFNNGESLRQLCQFYTTAILTSGLSFDMLFGQAYKGIPLVTGVAVSLAEQGHNFPFCFNRKETKDHGEGGMVVGAPLAGKVLILDDVISAGTSVRQAIHLIADRGAKPCGVVVSLDRMERGESELSATQDITRTYGLPVVALATLDDLVDYLESRSEMRQNLQSVLKYRQKYGVGVH